MSKHIKQYVIKKTGSNIRAFLGISGDNSTFFRFFVFIPPIK